MLLKHGFYVLILVMASATDVLLPMNYGKDMMETEDCTPSPCPEDDEAPPMLGERVKKNQTFFEKVENPENASEVITKDSMLFEQLANATVAENSTMLVGWQGWSGYVNQWDGWCQFGHGYRDRLLVGMYSAHWNSREDRRFSFLYRTWTRRWPSMMTGSIWWNGWTGWDAGWSYARSDAVMLSLWSYHSNSYEDRRFNILWQKINKPLYYTTGAYFTGWSWWDSTQSQACTTNAWAMGLYSYHNNGREDRRFNLYCQRIYRTNPCSRNPCKSRGKCTAYNGNKNYRCACYKGYAGSSTCNNINECVKKPCGKGNGCTDTVGSYKCRCAEGYTGTGTTKCTGRYVTKNHLVPIPANGKKYGQ